jgi:hypothetical protein
LIHGKPLPAVSSTQEIAMSFDIFFKTARYTGAPVVKKNPFTGEDQTIIPSEPLTAAEERAVREVLEKVNAQWRDAAQSSLKMAGRPRFSLKN